MHGKKIKGLNEYINLYNQENPDKKLPKLKVLYKQILSDKTTTSFKIDKIENDNELIKKGIALLQLADEKELVKSLKEEIEKYR